MPWSEGKSTTTAIAASTALLAGGALGSAQSATANSGDAGYVVAPACVYYGPSYFYGIAYCTSYNAYIPLGCWTDDGQGHRWFSFYLQSARWVLADDVQQQPSLPHC